MLLLFLVRRLMSVGALPLDGAREGSVLSSPGNRLTMTRPVPSMPDEDAIDHDVSLTDLLMQRLK